MKILMTADTVGGVWTYALQLARAVERYQVRVDLATMGAPLSDEQWAAAGRISTLTVHESSYKLEWMHEPWEDVEKAGKWLLQLERGLQPDVVHLNEYSYGALPWNRPAFVVGHSCVLSWWDDVKGETAPPEWSQYRHRVGRGLRAARTVVTPTEAMLRALRKYYGPLPGSSVIYNAQEAMLFPPLHKQPYVMAMGRLWDEAKNITALCDVAPDLPWPVYVAGTAQHPEGGEAQLSNVNLLGQLTAAELSKRLGRACVFALPALSEPFGLSVLEAGLARCALVLGDIPSLREVWGDAALFVPPRDRDALRQAMLSLVEDETLRESMARRARARALEYSPRRMAGSYIDLYTRISGRQAWRPIA
jgi:glycogen synthase